MSELHLHPILQLNPNLKSQSKRQMSNISSRTYSQNFSQGRFYATLPVGFPSVSLLAQGQDCEDILPRKRNTSPIIQASKQKKSMTFCEQQRSNRFVAERLTAWLAWVARHACVVRRAVVFGVYLASALKPCLCVHFDFNSGVLSLSIIQRYSKTMFSEAPKTSSLLSKTSLVKIILVIYLTRHAVNGWAASASSETSIMCMPSTLMCELLLTTAYLGSSYISSSRPWRFSPTWTIQQKTLTAAYHTKLSNHSDPSSTSTYTAPLFRQHAWQSRQGAFHARRVLQIQCLAEGLH